MRSALEDEALKRKERLAKLKRRAEGVVEEEEEEEENAAEEAEPTQTQQAKFRSYQPETEGAGDVVGPAPVAAMEEAVAEQLAGTKEAVKVEAVDIALLAPRKIDWDLKRDIAPTLERLERRTQRAIGELIRERLASDEAQPDLLSEVNLRSQNAAAETNTPPGLSDDEND